MGELRQRGSIWWIRYYRNGKRYEETSGSNKKGVALTLLKTREGDIAKGMPISPEVGRLRFETAVADVVTDYRTNGKRTLDDVQRRITLHLTPFFGGRRMANITTADIRTFISQRQDAGASHAEINRELAIVKRAYRLALQAARLLTMPYVPMLRERNARQGFFEREQFEAVVRALPSDLRPLMTVAYFTGWRIISELLPLEWRHVDRQTGVLRLEPNTTKNGDAREFPYADLLPEVRDAIEAQWTRTKGLEQQQDRIIPSVFHRGGEPIRDFRDAWRTACKAAGCPGRIPHDFRRTAVRNLVRAGVPEKTAMVLTGHKTRSVFDRYDIVNNTDLREAVRKLGAREPTGTEQGQSAQNAPISPFRKSS